MVLGLTDCARLVSSSYRPHLCFKTIPVGDYHSCYHSSIWTLGLIKVGGSHDAQAGFVAPWRPRRKLFFHSGALCLGLSKVWSGFVLFFVPPNTHTTLRKTVSQQRESRDRMILNLRVAWALKKMNEIRKQKTKSGLVAHDCNHRTCKVEAGLDHIMSSSRINNTTQHKR